MNNKHILSIAIILLVSIFLAGCGAQAPVDPAVTNAPQSADPQPEPTEMTESEPTAVPTEAPEEAPADAPTGEVSFANDIVPIIQSRCINCHGGDRIEEGLLLRTYDEILAGSENGPVIVPGDVANSLFVELVANQKMPKRGPKLTPPQVQLITDWVAAGAPNN
jgi:mono/diheme cytochrome c family protein